MREFDTRLLPVERLTHQSELAVVGLWRCPADAPWFQNSGPMRNHCIVFPRTAVRIRRAAGDSLTADPTLVTLYHRGDEFTREAISSAGDQCDWFSVRTDILAEAVDGPTRSSTSEDRPLPGPQAPATPQICLKERGLIQRLEARCDPLEADEAVLELLTLLFPFTRIVHERLSESHVRLVERVKRVVARRFSERLPLQQLAALCGVSPWFLARVFRRVTGTTIHQYQNQLRLRESLSRVLRGDDLTAVGLELGFCTHSHFTQAFHRSFGVTPSGFKAAYVRQTRI